MRIISATYELLKDDHLAVIAVSISKKTSGKSLQKI